MQSVIFTYKKRFLDAGLQVYLWAHKTSNVMEFGGEILLQGQVFSVIRYELYLNIVPNFSMFVKL